MRFCHKEGMIKSNQDKRTLLENKLAEVMNETNGTFISVPATSSHQLETNAEAGLSRNNMRIDNPVPHNNI